MRPYMTYLPSIGMRSNKSADYRDCGFRHGEGGDFEETRRSFEKGTEMRKM